MRRRRMMIKRGIIWLFLVLSVPLACAGVTVSSGIADLTHEMVFLYDDESRDINSIRALPLDDWSRWTSFEELMVSFSDGNLWARIELVSEDATETEWILEWPSVYLNDTACYLIRSLAGKVLVQQPELREDPGFFTLRKCSIRIRLTAGETVTFLVRQQSKAHLSPGFRLYDTDGYLQAQTRRQLAIGLWIGLLFATILFVCLFIWSTKDISSVYFLLGYLFAFVSFSSFFGILPIDQRISFFGYKVLVVSCSAWSFACLLQHARAFFELRVQRKRLALWVKRYAGVLVIAGFVLPWFPYEVAIRTMDWVILFTLMMIVTVFIAMRSNRITYWLYLSAYCITLCYYVGFVLYFYLPQMAGFNVEITGLATFALVVMLCLTAFVVRMHYIREDRERLQREAYDLQRSMTDQLEQQVAERTRELEQSREEAEQACDVAQQANLAKTRFFGRISHDLRAPVNWLIGLSESLALQSGKLHLSEEFTEYLRQVQRGGIYLNQLLNNVLDIHAIESEHRKIIHTEFSLQEWSDGLEVIAQAYADTCGVRMLWRLDICGEKELDTCRSESVCLSQILMNLVHNAIRYTPKGRQVHVSICRKHDGLTLQVDDEGPGLPGNAEKLFRQFEQDRRNRDVRLRGIGLGLHIVQEYTDSLGGTVTCRNNVSGGAQFNVSIPVSVDEGDEEECV